LFYETHNKVGPTGFAKFPKFPIAGTGGDFRQNYGVRKRAPQYARMQIIESLARPIERQ
jgi:hypothetical protein